MTNNIRTKKAEPSTITENLPKWFLNADDADVRAAVIKVTHFIEDIENNVLTI